MVIPSSIRATTTHWSTNDTNRHVSADGDFPYQLLGTQLDSPPHADNPLGVRHLIITLPQRGRHLVRDGPRDNHDVRLPRRRAEDDTQAVLVVAWHREVHHLDCAAREAET